MGENLIPKNIYGYKLVQIPTLRFAVFYNGEKDQPEQYDLRLSDAYVHPLQFYITNEYS